MAREAARVAAGKGETPPLDVANVPHSVQAEQALLGAIMVNNRVHDDLEGALHPDLRRVPRARIWLPEARHAACCNVAAAMVVKVGNLVVGKGRRALG